MKRFSRVMISILGLTLGMNMSQVLAETKLRIVVAATFLISSLILSFGNSSKTSEGMRHLNICNISALIGLALVAILKINTIVANACTEIVIFITIVIVLIVVSKNDKKIN